MKPLARLTGLLTIFLTVSPAQLYVHDPTRESMAESAKSKFSDVTSKDTGLFPSMLANADAVHERDLAALKELNKATLMAFLNKLPSYTWANLIDDTRDTSQQFVDEIAQVKLRLQELKTQIGSTTTLADQLETQLAALRSDLDTKRAQLNQAPPKLKDFEDALDKIRLDNVKPDVEGLKKIAGAASSLQELNKLLDRLSAQPPGLQLVILDAGVELQKTELVRARTDLDYYSTLLRLEQVRLRDLRRVVGQGPNSQGQLHGPGLGMLLAQIRPAEDGLNKFCAKQDELIMTTMKALANQAAHEPNAAAVQMKDCKTPPPDARRDDTAPMRNTLQLRNLLDVLEQYASITGFEHYLLEAAELDREHAGIRHAIGVSAANARGREILIAHGLQGLSQYYAGGWKPEDTANLFRALQTITQGVIAGKVN